MNVVSRGVKNTLRSPLRSGAIALIFAISVALVLSMLVAKSSVQSKIDEIKTTAGTAITIRPAGVMGAMGGGDPLTATQLTSIKNTAHITSTVLTLTDQASTDDTNLQSSMELGAFGRRLQRQSTDTTEPANPSDTAGSSARPAMQPRVTITGTTDVNSLATNGSNLTISSGSTVNTASSDHTALLGTALATKNNLAVNDTFTLYGQTFTVAGIYTTGNTFQDGGVVVPLATLQTLTNQADAVNSITAMVDSSDNVAATVAALKTSLGSDADITSEVERAESSVASLKSVSSLATGGVVAAAVAGAAIILLAMVMIVRERRKEIGVMKAIGGTDGKVVGQFIIEGLSLTVIGALIGLGLGVLVSGPMTTSLVSSQNNASQTTQTRQAGTGGSSGSTSDQGGAAWGRGGFEGGINQVRATATQVSASLTPSIFGMAIGVTLLIALVGTAVPAWFTARIRPAEVLRTE